MSARSGLLISLLVIAATQAACTRSETRSRVHDNAIPTSPTSGSTPSPENARRTRALLSGEASNLDDLAYFTPETLADTKKLATPEARTALSRLNKALLRSLLAGNAERKALELYESAALQGCDAELKGCSTLLFFKSDPTTYEIVRLLAERQQDLRKKYRLLGYAYSVVSGSQNTFALDNAYLDQAADYDKLLLGENKPALRLRHLELLKQILSAVANDSQRIISRSVIDSFKTWNIDSAPSEELAEVIELLRLVSVKRQTITAESSTALAAELMKRPLGIETGIKSTVARYPRAFRNLSLRAKFAPSVELFIFEGLWSGVLDQRTADELMKQHLSGDAARAEIVRGLLLDYARARLAVTTFEMQAKMTAFFRDNTGLTADVILDKAIEYAEDNALIWQNGLRRLSLMRTHYERNLLLVREGIKPGVTTNLPPHQKQLDEFFRGLPRNVKIMSTYPNMLLIAYHMAQLKFEIKVQTFTGVLEIDSAQILTWFIDGSFTPWLQFSDDKTGLNATEILAVFSFMFRTGILDDAGISIESFMKLAANQYLDQTRADVENINSHLLARFDGSPNFELGKKYCRDFAAKTADAPLPMPGTQIEALTDMTGLGIPRAIFHDVKTPIITAISDILTKNMDRPPPRVTLDYFSVEEFYERVRLDYLRRLDRVQTLVSLALAHVKDTEGEIPAKGLEAKTDAILNPYLVEAFKFYEKMRELSKELIPCFTKLVRHEVDTQLFLLKELKKHFAEVHAKMKALRDTSPAATSGPQRLETDFHLSMKPIGNAGPRFVTSLAKHEEQLGYSRGFYKISAPQLLLRAKMILEGGPTPPRAPGTFRLPETIENFSLALRNWSIEIPYQENPAMFEGIALRSLIRVSNGSRGLFTWYDLAPLAGMLKDLQRSLAVLVKAGKVPTKLCAGGKPCEEEPLLSAKAAARLGIELADLFELSEEWIEMLRTVGLNTRIDYDIGYKDVVMRSTEDEPIGLLDYSFKLMREGVLGFVGEIEGLSSRFLLNPREKRLNEAKTYFATVRKMGTHSFPAVGKFDRILDDFYDSLIRRELEPLRDLIREAKRVEADSAARGVRLPKWRLKVTPAFDTVPVLSRIQLEGYASDLYEFERETQRFFPPDLAKPLTP